MDTIKHVKFLRAIAPEEENTEQEINGELMDFADYFDGELLGFCVHEGEIMAIIADDETGKLYQVRLDEVVVNNKQAI